MNTILIVCDKIQEINRLRRNFEGSPYTIKATGAMQSASYVAATSEPSLIVYQLGDDYSQFFAFYKQLRESEQTANIPLLLAADISVMKPFSDHISLRNAHIVSTGITKDSMLGIVDKMIKQQVYGYNVAQ
ncbi:MAG: hypothetical protein LBN42_04815 [Oscillospiraceae bacterium]|jgi:CheY-like chemotaxis protein|nr:hypothetical protein [Oscillospiraceae bacterium]